jgi:hypothetical protein
VGRLGSALAALLRDQLGVQDPVGFRDLTA